MENGSADTSFNFGANATKTAGNRKPKKGSKPAKEKKGK